MHERTVADLVDQLGGHPAGHENPPRGKILSAEIARFGAVEADEQIAPPRDARGARYPPTPCSPITLLGSSCRSSSRIAGDSRTCWVVDHEIVERP